MAKSASRIALYMMREELKEGHGGLQGSQAATSQLTNIQHTHDFFVISSCKLEAKLKEDRDEGLEDNDDENKKVEKPDDNAEDDSVGRNNKVKVGKSRSGGSKWQMYKLAQERKKSLEEREFLSIGSGPEAFEVDKRFMPGSVEACKTILNRSVVVHTAA